MLMGAVLIDKSGFISGFCSRGGKHLVSKSKGGGGNLILKAGGKTILSGDKSILRGGESTPLK